MEKRNVEVDMKDERWKEGHRGQRRDLLRNPTNLGHGGYRTSCRYCEHSNLIKKHGQSH